MLSATAAGLVALGSCAPGALAASPPTGTLTNHEFTLLTAAKLGLDQALQNKGSNWQTAARNACLTVTFGGSTPLLTSEKADCLGSLSLNVDLTSFPQADARCSSRGEKGKVACLAPLYKTLARDSAGAYAGDLNAFHVSVKRGFTGTCLATLGATQKQLRNDRNLVASTRQLSADMQLLVKISDGRASPTELSQTTVDAHTRVFQRDIGAVLREGSPDDLNSCPHQTS